jgi:hypothetical protein
MYYNVEISFVVPGIGPDRPALFLPGAAGAAGKRVKGDLA